MEFQDKLKAMRRYVDAYDEYAERRATVNLFAGELVRWLRTLCKMSVRQFAAKVGVSPSYLSKLERGKETLSPELARTILDWSGK